jgi:enamine deaminase RidA (YjgF/YER057c/UK114 family)
MLRGVEKVQPSGVHDPVSYAQCIRTGNTLYLSGQIALDEHGRVASAGHVEAQAHFVWRQIGRILEAAGAGYANIAKVTTFLVNMADRETSMRVRKEYLGEHVAASTLVGISSLAQPELLIEVEVVAVLE